MAQRQLSTTTKAIARSLARLSSGSRANSAFDGDVVALAQSNKLEAQTRGLRQANQNINQAIGMINTAESAIDVQINIVNRMREIAIEASNGILSTSDRNNLNNELNQLLQEFQRITNQTEFNGTKLLDGSFGQKTLQISANTQSGQDLVQFEIGNLNSSNVFTKTVGSGSFDTPVNYFATESYKAVVGDFNGDGKQDIAAADVGADQVRILLGKGDGTFTPSTSLSAGSFPYTIRLADFNGDGVSDLITSDIGDQTVSIFIGNGDGTFKARMTLAAGQDVVITDINGDGKQDIITSNAIGYNLFKYLGNGDGTFQSAVTMNPITIDAFSVFELADMNGDGLKDLINYDGPNDFSRIYLANGQGDFEANASYEFATSFAGGISVTGDFNGDGKMDFIGTGNNQVFFGDGTGVNFTAGATLPGNSHNSGTNLVAIDVNGDGALDVVGGNGKTYLNNGAGTFTVADTNDFNSSSYLTNGDFNGDGVADIVNLSDSDGIQIAIARAYSTSAASGADMNVSTQSSAKNLLDILDDALTSLKGEQAKLGGLHSRLDMAAANNLLISESLEEARSNAKDTDLALETAELVRNQILQQAQVAILAQANVQLSLVLQLLKFDS